MTIKYLDSKRISLDTSATFSEDFSSSDGWTIGTGQSITGGYLYSPKDSANAHDVHSIKSYAIGNPDDMVLNWDWKYVGADFKLPFIILSSTADGYGDPTEGNKRIILKNNNSVFNVDQRYFVSGGSNLEDNGTSDSATPVADTMYYYQFIKDGNDISVKRYGSIADRTAQTSEQQTLTDTWTGVGYTGTADIAYIVIGSYGNYGGDAGANYMYDFKLYSGVTSAPAKPTNVEDNSILVEKDTGKRYWFDLGVEPKGTSGSGGDWAETSFNNSAIVNNESASGNVVTRTSGSGWNSYIRSNEYISPSTDGGEIYFTQSANTNISVGLEKSPFNPAPSATYTGKDYSFHTTSSSNNMYEHTSDYAGTAWASATNEYRITMDSAGLVKYYWRSGSSGAWTLERTSTVTASGDYYFTVSHSGTAGAITSYIKGTPATWTDPYAVILATRGVIGGGHNSGNTNVMDYITIATTGNATDFGDLTQARYGIASVYSDTRGCFAGGYSGSYHTIIDYITTLTTGNATDFGDLTTATYSIAGVSNLTRGVVNNGGTSRSVNMEYITINTLGDATTFGNLTVSATSMAGNVNSETRGIFSGGNRTSSVFSNVIDYITIDTTGNATDFGDLTLGRYSPSGLSSETRGLIYGGLQTGSSIVNTIDYVTIATTGNATDFGDLCGDAVEVAGGLTNDTRGCMAGLNSGSNTICYSTIATLGNASDFGDLTVARAGGGGVSG